MAEPGSGCDDRRESHPWTEVGGRRVCRNGGLIDVCWSLSGRRMVEALRRAGSTTRDAH